MNAILNRHSTRNYDGTIVPDEDIEKIEKIISEINRKSELSFKFVKNGEDGFNGGKSYGVFTGVKSVILLCGNTKVENMKERVGYYGQELVLSLTSMGYDTCWVGGSFSKGSFAQIAGEDKIVCITPVGKGAGETPKQSLMGKVMNFIMTKGRKSAPERVTSDSKLPKWVEEGLHCMTYAPSAMNAQKPHCTYTNGVLNIGVKGEGGFNLVDLGIAKKHFELGAGGKFEEGNNAKFTKIE